MEQTVNTFGKGLQIDTHPMVQGNETLSDALNATFITMNGNEIVLQNDMGNRRVDNAYLPPGYTPVGMKEYGGIIYIAAYNPITNKSQIGSFPSPQRKFNNQGTSNNELDLSSIWNGNNIEHDKYLGIDVIKSDSIMIPLTKDTTLHAGDKFVVYSTQFNESYDQNSKDLITNYYNTWNGSAITPKNKYFTLQLGILNSQNEFVDITKTLQRWKKDTITGKYFPVKYEEQSVSDVFKFNDGYFIPGEYGSILEGNTINDAKFIQNRQVITANTYSYKLVGPLYLKAVYNHIQNFNYNIYGIKDGDNVILWFEGVITYNCPDGKYGDVGIENKPIEDYLTYDETEGKDFNNLKKFNPFALYFDENSSQITYKSSSQTTYTSSKYDLKTNTYLVTCTKKYDKVKNPSSGKINYVIGVLADPSCNLFDSKIYIKGLSAKGVIDTSLLGSGTIKVNEWRFYNNVNSRQTTLTFSLDAYPKYKEKFENLRLKLWDITKGETYSFWYPSEESGLPVYNGRQTITLDWSETKIDFRKVYAVKISYDTVKEDGSRSTNHINDKRWILTTELFNEFYKADSGIKDYCNVKNPGSTGQEELFNSKMIIGISSSSDVELIKDYSEEESDNDLYTLSNEKIGEYSIKHIISLKTSSNKISIYNEELYPDFITLNGNPTSEIDNVKITKIGETDINDGDNINNIFKENIDFVSPKTATVNLNSEKFIEFDSEEVKITYYDRLKGKNDKRIEEVTNVFGNFLDHDYITNVSSNVETCTHNYIAVTNTDSQHICVVHKMPWDGIYQPNSNSNNQNEYSTWIDDGNSQERKFNQISQNTYTKFNDLLTYNSGLTLLYGFPGKTKYTKSTNKDTAEHEAYALLTKNGYCRVWWRTYDERWALIPDLFNCNTTFDDSYEVSNSLKDKLYGTGNESFYKFIKDRFHSNSIIFCMWDDYYDRDIYTIGNDYIYNNNYNVPIKITINYKSLNSNGLINGINNNHIYGNLQFKKNENSYQIVPLEKSLTLSSSENFQDKAYNIRNMQSLSNIYITNNNNSIDDRYKKIITRDSIGNPLNSNILYLYIDLGYDEMLVKQTKFKFKIDKENKTQDGKNTLVCVTNRLFNSMGQQYYKSDIVDDTSTNADANMILDYNTASIVTFPSLRENSSSSDSSSGSSIIPRPGASY